MTINKVTFGNNTFCGPSVISIITGISTDEAANKFYELRKRDAVLATKGKSVGLVNRNIKAVFVWEIEEVLRSMGYRVEHFSDGGSVYFNLLTIKDDGIYVFNVPMHVVVLERSQGNWFICDNHTKQPINAGNSARLSQKVIQYLKVTKYESNKTVTKEC